MFWGVETLLQRVYVQDDNFACFLAMAGRRQNKPFAVNMPHYVVRNSFLLPVAELSSAIFLFYKKRKEGIDG